MIFKLTHHQLTLPGSTLFRFPLRTKDAPEEGGPQAATKRRLPTTTTDSRSNRRRGYAGGIEDNLGYGPLRSQYTNRGTG